MIRMFAVVAVSATLGVIGFTAAQPQAENLRQNDIASLKEKRIELLEQRVARIKEHVERSSAEVSDLLRPQMDVINARLDYADSNRERKKLLDELIAKYEKLIELEKTKLSWPRPIGSRASPLEFELQILLLQSERIRVLVLRDSLD